MIYSKDIFSFTIFECKVFPNTKDLSAYLYFGWTSGQIDQGMDDTMDKPIDGECFSCTNIKYAINASEKIIFHQIWQFLL